MLIGQLGGNQGRQEFGGDGVVFAMFSKHVGRMESNEAEVVAILETLCIFVSSSFQEIDCGK